MSAKGSAATGRYGHSCVVLDQDRVLVFGGYDADASPTNDVHVIDMTKKKWVKVEQKGERPSPRLHHTANVRHER